MCDRRMRRCVAVFAFFAVLLGAAVGFAEQREPSAPPTQGQPVPGPMGPGMMMGPMMAPQMTDQMNQMMQACVQMMNQMAGLAPGQTSPAPPTPRAN